MTVTLKEKEIQYPLMMTKWLNSNVWLNFMSYTGVGLCVQSLRKHVTFAARTGATNGAESLLSKPN